MADKKIKKRRRTLDLSKGWCCFIKIAVATQAQADAMRDMYASNEFNKLLKKYEIDDCVKMYCGKTRVGVVERGLIAAAGLKNVLLGTNDVVKAMSHKEFVDWGSVPIPDTTPTKSIGNVEVVASE